MVKLINILVLASGICATAFSLERARLNSNAKVSSNTIRKSAAPQVHGTSTLLKSAESSSGSSSDIVAKAKAPATFIDTIWNENTKLSFYLLVWYAGNILYNIYNKKACNALGKNSHGGSNLHWALSAVQLLVGVIAVIPLWLSGIRKAPKLTLDNWKELAPVGLFTSLAHAFSVLALGAGAVSFGQIVKAGEPVFAAATNAVLLGDIDHPLVYASLIPIIGGVGLASLKELSFTWTSLIAASSANQAAALKNVVSKGVMNKPWAKALGPENNYSVVTILALLFTLPFVLAFDVRDFASVYDLVVKAGKLKEVIQYSILSGLTFYIYNEASFAALEKLSPVTHSVANTLKRVVIIVVSCIVFKTEMTLLGGIGSGIAVLGTLLYSLAKKQFKKGGGSGH